MMIVYVLFLALLALSTLAAALWRTSLWGLGAWGVISVPLGVLLAGVAVVIFAWQAAARNRPVFPGERRTGEWRTAVVCIASFAVLWLLRTRHDLWGERHAIARAVESGIVVRPGAPLGTALNWLIYRFMNATFISNGVSSSALLSVLAGTGFVAVAIRAARFITRGDRPTGGGTSDGSGNELAPADARSGGDVTDGGNERPDARSGGGNAGGSAAALIVANGFAVVFFGGGGNTAVCTLTALLFIYAALRSIRGESHLIVPAVLLPLAVFTHLSAAYLVPAFVYCVWRAYRAPGTRRQVPFALAVIIGCWAALEAALALATNATGPTRYVVSLAAGALHARSNLFYEGATDQLLTALNGFLILGPASTASLTLLTARAAGRRHARVGMDAEQRLLAIATVCAFLLFPLAARRIDGGLRWDIFAATGPAFALFTLRALWLRAGTTGTFRRGTTLLVTLGLFHMLPLVVCAVHTGTAQKRLLSLPIPPGKGAFIIAERAFELREYRTAADWYTTAIQQDQDNHMAHARLGTIYMKRENYIDAITSYLAAVQRAPENSKYRFLLSEAYIAKNWLEEAVDNLEQLADAYPDSVRFWRRLGYARNHSHLYREALEAYERALDLEPGNDENVRNLTSAVLNRAAQLQGEERYDEARALYRRAQGLYPTDWRAVNNLAVMEMQMENIDKAFSILRSALQMHPFVPELNLNMGLVLEKRGENKAALSYLQKSAELDPLHSGAGPHIERLLRKLADEE
jgi:tetratricopeptide (TPR) repeat protein